MKKFKDSKWWTIIPLLYFIVYLFSYLGELTDVPGYRNEGETVDVPYKMGEIIVTMIIYFAYMVFYYAKIDIKKYERAFSLTIASWYVLTVIYMTATQAFLGFFLIGLILLPIPFIILTGLGVIIGKKIDKKKKKKEEQFNEIKEVKE